MEYNYIIDSCVWVAFFDTSDSNHLEARKLSGIIQKVEIMPDFILAETATVLKLKKHFEIAKKFVEEFSDNQECVVVTFLDEYQDSFSKEFVKIENKNLSYIDSSLLALHKTKKYKVITFDKNLKKLLK